MIDLHCHSTFSDGSLTPSALMEKAGQLGMRALALTDHDTIEGWGEAASAARLRGVEFVPGVELSTLHKGRLMHILGYYPNPSRMREHLRERLKSRQRRTALILQRLGELGMPLPVPVWGEADAPGRPHIAEFMVAAGYVASKREAFDIWIGEDKPAYIPYEPYTAVQGVSDLLACGAVPVWAHPGLYTSEAMESVLVDLCAAGLRGIEAFHPCHSDEQVAEAQGLAVRCGLIVTGGSDYHGPIVGDNDRTHRDLNALGLAPGILLSLKGAASAI